MSFSGPRRPSIHPGRPAKGAYLAGVDSNMIVGLGAGGITTPRCVSTHIVKS